MTLTEYFQKGQMTRQAFAAAVGVSPVTVYRWERGHRLPVKHFVRIAEVTGNEVTPNDFVPTGEAAQ